MSHDHWRPILDEADAGAVDPKPQIECETTGCTNEVFVAGEFCTACRDANEPIGKCWACGGLIHRDRFTAVASCDSCYRIWEI